MMDNSYYYTVNSYGPPSSIFPLDKVSVLYTPYSSVKAAFYHRRKKLSESVDSICRDGADTPISPIQK